MRRALPLLMFCLWSQVSGAETVTVAVAANFATTLRAIAGNFEQSSGHQLRIISGSSGKLFAQIINGAPFDVFLSADQCKPQALVERGLGLADTRRTYAVGRLAVWAPNHATAPLPWSTMKRIAIANPRTAPYGAAALSAIRHMNTLPASVKRVQAENVAQVYQFTATGNVDAGFVALALLRQPQSKPQGTVWVVPEAWHEPIRQDLIVLQGAANRPGVTALLAWLTELQTQQRLLAAGYTLPAATDETAAITCR